MSSKQHRSLHASPAGIDTLESLQHMTSWARQTMTSPEAAPMRPRFENKMLASVIDGFALGATAFHPGPWVYPIDAIREANLGDTDEAKASRPGIGARALRAIGAVTMRFWRNLQERHEAARATRLLAEMDDRTLRDIGLSRADIGRAVRHGRDWERWH
ncbi:DUF1127 domain-containing protein [Dongia sedimenti]|uniref:DUF1127 domain-containing protein n=1 Tax=Dongia sedimenti TaxID=3064282 RepID=A0ABU0YUD1_9PROT|nr:DUF1127 domain-containing protein [Rhodospirillaceae bacterium R-7]